MYFYCRKCGTPNVKSNQEFDENKRDICKVCNVPPVLEYEYEDGGMHLVVLRIPKFPPVSFVFETKELAMDCAMDCIQKHLHMMDCSEEEIVRALALRAPVFEREVINPYSRALPAGWV